jgi:hypothetical protein
MNKHENKEQIIKILNEEMLDTKCKCFTGRISRLVNVLNGYYNDINIKIFDSEQIGAIIPIIKSNYNGDDVNELKKIIKNNLIERNINDEVIEEWLEHVDI